MTLNCSVTPKQCDHEVKWLNNDKDTEDYPELKLSRSGCSVSVSFTDSSPPSQFYRTLKCEVKQRYTNNLFTFFPQSPPEDKPTTPSTPSSTSSSTGISVDSALTSLSIKPTHERGTRRDMEQTRPEIEMTYLLKIVLPVAVVVVLIVAFAILMLWRRRKGSGDTNGDTVKPDDGVTYASVQINQKRNNDRKRPQSRDGEDVTYSSVNVPGQSRKATGKTATGEPEDGVTYASVNFDSNNKKKKKKKQSGAGSEEEDVTYSSVMVSAAAAAQSDPAQLYSSVHKHTRKNI